MIILPKDLLSNTYRQPDVYLCQTDKKWIGRLSAKNLNGTFKWNSYHEITFDIDRTYIDLITGEKKTDPYFDLTESLRVVYLEGFGYYQIQDPDNTLDGFRDTKSIKAYSKEYELSQKYLELFIINEGTTGSIDGVQLYNEFDQEHSLLNLVLCEKFPDWSVGHVDAELKTEQRTFNVDRQSVYDFLMNDVCGTFKCVIIFDTVHNTVNVYKEETAGSETDVMISFDNLATSIKLNYSADDIKTVLTVTGDDDLDIRSVNFGLPYIVDLSYYHTVEWMGQDLYDAYQTYLDKMADMQETHESLLNTIRTCNTNILELTNRQGKVLISDAINAFYTPFLCDFYQNDYVVNDEYLSETKEDLSFIDANTWSTLEDALNNISLSSEEKDAAIYAFWDIVLDNYGLTELTAGYDARAGVNTVQATAGWSDESSREYHSYYANYILMKAVESKKNIRTKEIKMQQELLDTANERMNNLGLDIALDANFTKEQLSRLSPFLREDEYNDNCFVVTDIDTEEEIINTKIALRDTGAQELKKMCQPKLAFETQIANLFALEEFKPIQSQFQLGNMIKVKIRDGYIKKSRLIEVSLNFEKLNSLTVKFGDLLSTRSQADIHADLLAQAITAGKQVSDNKSYWQAGSNTATEIQTKISQGLLDAATEIKSIDGTQNVVIDKYGIHMRDVDNNGYVDPRQGWIVSNKILYTDNNWKSTKSVFGEYQYDVNGDGIPETLWGILADALVGGYIEGSEIVGGKINIGDGTFVVHEDGRVSMFGGSIGNTNIEDLDQTLKDVDDFTSSKMYRVEVRSNGSQIMTKKGQSAILNCVVYSWDTDITDTLDSSLFSWKRTSSNADQDVVWNANARHIGTKSITITTEDIQNNASFSCEVDLPD